VTARPLLCTRCHSPVAVAEDARSLIDWGPAVVDADGVVRPQYPDPADDYQSITYDVDHGRARAVCSNPKCGHQWTLRRRFDPERQAP
jgi:hypothetical protein